MISESEYLEKSFDSQISGGEEECHNKFNTTTAAKSEAKNDKERPITSTLPKKTKLTVIPKKEPEVGDKKRDDRNARSSFSS
jgi:hypothetical protein